VFPDGVKRSAAHPVSVFYPVLEALIVHHGTPQVHGAKNGAWHPCIPNSF
jgi:hypothetical protein